MKTILQAMLGVMRRRAAWVIVVLTAVTATTGVAADKDVIIFGIGVDASYLAPVIAYEKGFMRKHGVEGNYRQFTAGNVAIEGLIAGDVDMSMGGELATLVPYAKGARIAALARGLYSDKLLGIAGRRDIRGPNDLIGKTVGVMKGGASEYYFNLYLTKNGLDPKSIRVLNVQTPEMVPAMVRGEIDAFFAWEPWFTRAALAVPGSHTVTYSGVDGTYRYMHTLITSDTALQRKPEAVRNAMRGLIDATEWLNDPKNRAEAIKIAVRVFRTPEADASRQLGEELVYVMDLIPEYIVHLRGAAKWLKSKDMIKTESTDELVDKLVKPSVLQEVAPTRVLLK